MLEKLTLLLNKFSRTEKLKILKSYLEFKLKSKYKSKEKKLQIKKSKISSKS